MSTALTFGLVVPSSAAGLEERIDGLLRWIGVRADATFQIRSASSYEALGNGIRDGALDVAWLPPIVFVRLGEAVVAPLASVLRGGKASYEAALVVAADSRIHSIDGLRGTRAGWVDPWSAAGFVLPRVRLALLGIDPRTCFRSEMFHGSHRKAIEALLDGRCDVAGTYARADDDGSVTAGAWSEIPGAEVRIVATFDAVPPDVIGVRTSVPEDVRALLLAALRDACADASMSPIVREVFGGDVLHEGLVSGYDSLKSALAVATSRGLFD